MRDIEIEIWDLVGLKYRSLDMPALERHNLLRTVSPPKGRDSRGCENKVTKTKLYFELEV